MARQPTQTIPDDKQSYFYNKLMREISHLFKWEGLPETIPQDFIEGELCKDHPLLFYYSEKYGYDIMPCAPFGLTRHGRHATAQVNINTDFEQVNINRSALYMSNSAAYPTADKSKDGVIIYNMPLGYTLREIINHFVPRLVMAQQAYDTNLAWSNAPYIFQASSKDMQLSIEKMFSDILTGKPAVIVDSMILEANRDRLGVPRSNLWVKELNDNINELYMGFMKSVGFETSGIEKAERVNTLEVRSNKQHTKSVIEVMLQQRRMAAECINHYFDQNITVDILKPDPEEGQEEIEGGGQHGNGNNRAAEAIGDGKQ